MFVHKKYRMDSLSVIKFPIKSELEDFARLFESSLSGSNLLLNNVVSHIQHKNGKMMRPMLVLLAAKLSDKVSQATLHAAVSLELLHNASLMHDDVVDESNKRRGQLSVNAIFDNKVAVLSGDYLLATSVLHISKTQNPEIVEMLAFLGQELSDGELLQLSSIENTEFSESLYFEIIRKKTATLFAACAKAGVLSVRGESAHVEIMRKFGEYIGLCFQIKDDIFDYYESKNIGKPTGSDMLEGKLTLPVLYALNTTRDEQACNLALKVKKGQASPADVSSLIAFAKEYGGIDYSIQVMEDFRAKALDLLSHIDGDEDVKAALTAYLDYVITRDK